MAVIFVGVERLFHAANWRNDPNAATKRVTPDFSVGDVRVCPGMGPANGYWGGSRTRRSLFHLDRRRIHSSSANDNSAIGNGDAGGTFNRGSTKAGWSNSSV